MLKFRILFYLAALTFAALANVGVQAEQWQADTSVPASSSVN